MAEVILLSKEELDSFKEELISQLKKNQNLESQSSWMRSKNVRKLLGISDSTLQTFRINGTIPSYKLGTSWFYKYDEIVAALESGKTGKRGLDE